MVYGEIWDRDRHQNIKVDEYKQRNINYLDLDLAKSVTPLSISIQ